MLNANFHPHPHPSLVPQQIMIQAPVPTVKKEHNPTAPVPDKRHVFNVMNTESQNKLKSWIV